jgi:Spy/CpxP family protein refolding chaperone
MRRLVLTAAAALALAGSAVATNAAVTHRDVSHTETPKKGAGASPSRRKVKTIAVTRETSEATPGLLAPHYTATSGSPLQLKGHNLGAASKCRDPKTHRFIKCK